MVFEWDDEKEQKNIAKHVISFRTAMLVFQDDERLEKYDAAHSLAGHTWLLLWSIQSAAQPSVLSPQDSQPNSNRRYIMVVKTTFEERGTITEDEIAQLNHAQTMPITFDEDSPELSAEDLKTFHRISEENRKERNKQTVTLRLSPQALKKARSLGKGYTSILSRMLENDLNSNEIILRYL